MRRRKNSRTLPKAGLQSTKDVGSPHPSTIAANVLATMSTSVVPLSTNVSNPCDKTPSSHLDLDLQVRKDENLNPTNSLKSKSVKIETPMPIRCPVCSKELKFMPSNSDFRATFKSSGVIKAMRAHVAEHHAAEPVWNCLPKLDLQRNREAPGKRQKEDTATVPGLIAQSLASAARFVTLPDTDEWLWDWKEVSIVMTCRLGAAMQTSYDGTVYLRGRNIVYGAAPGSAKEQRAWLKREAFSYLKDLSRATLLPSEFWKSIVSPIRRRNLIQVFFFHGQAHRDCGLFERSTFPPSLHFDE